MTSKYEIHSNLIRQQEYHRENARDCRRKAASIRSYRGDMSESAANIMATNLEIEARIEELRVELL